MLLGNQSNPGGQVASGRERRPIAYLCDQRGCDDRTDARDALEPPAFLTRSVPGVDVLFDGADLYSQGCILAGQSIEAEPCSGWNAIVLLVSIAEDSDVVGVELDGSVVVLDGLVPVAFIAVGETAAVPGAGIVRVEPDRLGEVLNGR